MVLINAQIGAFFTNADQMALPADKAAKIREEGVSYPEDLL